MEFLPKSIDLKKRRHVARLHKVLLLLGGSIKIDSDDVKSRSFGDQTIKVLANVKRKLGLAADAKLGRPVIDVLNQKAIEKYFSTKTQTAKLHRALSSAARIAKIECALSEDSKTRTQGEQTAQVIRNFQKRYNIKETGSLNVETLERLQSVTASRARPAPVVPIKVQATERLMKVRNPLRLNMSKSRVADLQKAMAWCGYSIDATEFKAQTYGKTTRDAVITFQQKYGLPVTGNVGWKTANRLNSLIAGNSMIVSCKDKYRVRGSVRDDLWQGVKYAKVQVFERGLRGEKLLAERKTLSNGFYDMQYLPPVDTFTGKPKEAFQLVVKLLDDQGAVVKEKAFKVAGKLLWANFTDGEEKYLGESSFQTLEKALKKALGTETQIERIEESANHKDVSYLQKETVIAIEDIMKMSIAFRIAVLVNQTGLDAEVFYAFIRQNVPPTLPGDFLPDSPEEWNDWIGTLVENAAEGIIFTEKEIQADVLKSALKQNYISRRIAKNLPGVLTALDRARTMFALEKPLLEGNGNLKTLLNHSSVSAGKHDAVAQCFASEKGFSSNFWKTVAQVPGVSAVAVKDLRTTTDLGFIASCHEATVSFLKAQLTGKGARAYAKASDFAKLSKTEWASLITKNGNQIPDWIEGATLAKKKEAYAALLKTKAEQLFPAVSFIADVKRSKGSALGSVNRILTAVENKDDFNLRTDNLDALLTTTGSSLNEHERAALKVLQRVHRITPSSEAGVVLLQSGCYSAMQVCRMGKVNLVQAFAAKSISKEVALQVFDASENQYALVLNALTKFRQVLQRVTPGSIPSPIFTSDEIDELKKDIPDIETLFGSLDMREVKHCESVLGPSAYLTDLFRFLDEKKSKTVGKSVKDVLFGRRPDLGNIKLNCCNTDTALPYIDLVCELLENYVVDPSAAMNLQTTWDSAQLRAEPEHVLPDAYDTLKGADYPMTYSCNLWQEEARAFLGYLDIPRHALMQTFLVDSSVAQTAKNHANIAAEYFGISTQEQEVIVTARPTSAWQKRYWSDSAYGPSMPVSVFLYKTGLEYRQLLGLLKCDFVNTTAPFSEILCPLDDSDLEKQTVTHLSAGRLDKMNRFLRLWRRSGLAMWELDLLLMDSHIGGGTLNKTFLVALHKFDLVRKALKLGVEEAAAFYGDINVKTRFKQEDPVTEDKNLFQRLFLSGAVEESVYTEFEKLLTVSTTALDLSQFTQHLLSSLSLTADDLALLTSRTDAKLTRASLSVLFRYSVLARQMKLKLGDLLSFVELAGLSNPFDSIETILEVLKKKQLWNESGLSLAELQYVLTGMQELPVGLREEVLIQNTQTLRESLSSLQETILACEQAGDDSVKLLLAMLSPFADAVKLQTMLDIIAGVWSATPAQVATFIDETLGDIVSDIAEAQSALAYSGPVSGPVLATRRAYVKTELLRYLHGTAIKEFTAGAFDIDSRQAGILLDNLHLPSATESLLIGLQDEKLHEKDEANNYKYEVTRANFPEVFLALSLLHKASIAVNTLAMDAEELSWFVLHPAVCNTPDFNMLPIDPLQPHISLDAWLRLYRLLRFKRTFPAPEDASFFTVLEIAARLSPSLPALREELCKVTKWNTADLTLLHNTTLNYTAPQTYEWFLECHRQRKIFGADFPSLVAWARYDLVSEDKNIARNIKEIVKAKYAHDQWLTILQAIEDPLREKKRRALVAYLMEKSQREKPAQIVVSGNTVKNPEYWVTSDDLYAWFLIDVEMCSEQLTSRIKQAIGSTQLFVQRCFLNLEHRDVEVALPDSDIENNWQQWKWMKNYRIWEANRKVFLFPENWIEPELRDDKSPFFKELESDILSKEATGDNVEASLQRYIQKLEEVSKLEVCSVYHEINGPTNLFHVIARTSNVPPIYYYRTYDLVYSRWSAWEKIESDIHSDHIVPVIYNRKLHLFWIMFRDKPIKLKVLSPAAASDKPTMNPDPAKLLEIELAWTVRTHEGWDTRKISKKKLIHPWERPTFSYNLKPRYKADDNTLWIDLYISTSKEFNDGTFYDQYTHSKIRLTRVYYDETLRPWHSSSFVFDGDVREIRLRGIPGNYFSPEQGKTVVMSSYDYVKDNFGEDSSCLAKLSVIAEQLALPSGMHYSYTRLTNNLHKNINTGKFNVFDAGKATRTLLNGGQSPFEAVLCVQGLKPVDGKIRPVFYQDARRAFFIRQDKIESLWGYIFGDGKFFSAYPFYHPFSRVFQQEINRGGVEGLYQRNIQTHPQMYTSATTFTFFVTYQPVGSVNYGAAQWETIDFSRSGAYSQYNWELFFHAPLMIACNLSQNQRFEEAMQWFHYIFDPTNTQLFPTPQRFWVTKPFFETGDATYRKEQIKYIIEHIDEFRDQLTEWKNNPFKPHLIAQYRTVAYQKTVVMKYLDNLIAWGDQLFRRDTIESINEATLLYVLAGQLLGARPVMLPALPREEMTFNELTADGDLDIFGNAKVEVWLENTLGLPITYTAPESEPHEDMPALEISYYGLPHNDKLLQYWDTVADRLFKIRHGMNIEGLKRQLPLFEPPIDPALLVKAAAAGLDLAAVLTDLNAPSQAYRFRVLAGKAIEFCNEVKSLGDRLLAALERKDAEEIALLRATNEVTVLDAMRSIRELSIEELDNLNESFERRKEACQIRIDQIKSLSVPLDAETQASDWGTAATVFKLGGRASALIASLIAPAPDADVGANGVGGSAKVTAKVGGTNWSKVFEYIGKGLDGVAELCKWRQDDLNSQAAGERTKVEREARINAEQKDIDSLESQRLANDIRKQMAQHELDNFEKEVELMQAELEYLQNKYTGPQLYQWMLSKIATVYFQAYQLAYDMARRAEKSFRRELDLTDSSFIQFGYWDSLKKGLLTADRLNHDIRRMEAAYFEQHKRRLEITKHVSLARLAPRKLLELKATGRCSLDIEEWMYNLDYPGHYRRRIKSVSVTVPCETDPFTNINCQLTLHRSEVRVSNLVGPGYEKTGDDDERFLSLQGTGESIATTHCRDDHGLFQLDFGDERFLPFESAGAISSWDILLPKEHNLFDYSTMTDFVMHISYTAQDGGEALAAAANSQLGEILPDKGVLLVGIKQAFPAAWNTFVNPEPAGSERKVAFTVTKDIYPYLSRVRTIELNRLGIVIMGKYANDYVARVTIPGKPAADSSISRDPSLGDLHYKADVFTGTAPATGNFEIKVRRDTAGSGDFTSLPKEDITDMYVVLEYAQ